MKNIDEFLKKFTVIENPQNKKAEIARILNDKFGIKIEQENFDLNKGTLRFKVHPTLKSQIYIQKESILKELNENVQDLNLVSIT